MNPLRRHGSRILRLAPGATLLGVLLLVSSCSIQRTAMNRLGDTLAGTGTSFSSENDPELAREALPFALKLIESLLEEIPDHRKLRTAAAAYFTQYAYGFLQLEADYLEDEDWERAQYLRARARNLFLRGRDHGLHILGRHRPEFPDLLARSPREAVVGFDRGWVDTLYWTAAAWVSAINLGKEDPYLVADLPRAEALIDRAHALAPDWSEGAIHAFLVTYEMNRPHGAGDPETRARFHFDQALRAGGDHQLSPFISLAEAVSIPNQDLDEFESLLHRALAIDPEARPQSRLANLLMRKRARWLLSRTDEYFLPPLEEAPVDEMP